MKNFFDLIALRESCRNFSDKKVDRKTIVSLIEAARLAPSACNSQPWSFYIACGDKAADVAKCVQYLGANRFTDNCSAFTVVVEENAVLYERVLQLFKNDEFSSIDIGIAVAHYCLAATDLGLSTCIMGWLNQKKLKEVLNLPKEKHVRLVIATGYAATDTLRKKTRKDLDSIMHFID
ncbi:MAG: nitroreductase family protein [Eubacteriales bacterium]